jgi:hypothetical protein
MQKNRELCETGHSAVIKKCGHLEKIFDFENHGELHHL